MTLPIRLALVQACLYPTIWRFFVYFVYFVYFVVTKL